MSGCFCQHSAATAGDLACPFCHSPALVSDALATIRDAVREGRVDAGMLMDLGEELIAAAAMMRQAKKEA